MKNQFQYGFHNRILAILKGKEKILAVAPFIYTIF